MTADYIAMTWTDFQLVNLLTGLSCLVIGRVIGELKHNREDFIRKVRGVLDGLAG